jgi:hypothetical protein
MKKVETYPHETSAMFKFRLEKELAELESIDPALAEQHFNEVRANLRSELTMDIIKLCFWVTIFVAVIVSW